MKHNIVRIARAIRNQDIREFSIEMKYSPSLISRVENGERTVSKRLWLACDEIIRNFVKGY